MSRNSTCHSKYVRARIRIIMIRKNVPFYANTADNTHCFQASLKMVMKYFWPNRNYSWKKLDKITAKIPGLWTWPMAGLIWLQKQGIEIAMVEAFDYSRFIKLGGEYLIEEFGKEVGEAQIKHSNIDQEIRFAKEFLERIKIEKRIPKLKDIKRFLKKGYVIICNVNSRKLAKKEGYVGHFIVIFNFNDKYLFLHNPGLPPQKNQRVSFKQFEKAWAYPNERAKGIIALRINITNQDI